jgi:hypothetical protein
MVGGAGHLFDDHGDLTDQETRARLVELMDALRAWTVRIDLGEVAA